MYLHSSQMSFADVSHSWWNGANIPGKKVQPLSWAGGLPSYMQMLDETLENDYQGWTVERKSPDS